ncbi:hypothetical protein B5C34_07285 [Pacificimonas flava]|uniref:HAD family hydrolase n=2 Tax=Pacificimonas TaxID=1960290 RepID=A0A219B546_9SPHN|nr:MULTISPECIES: hypothetical protein [Pacificimonas]MBZ6379531.1 HAD family hydrolase [Pacificimonas aurantium]OWV33283.1 hypothetical protein B5C34_07285 [Pacificimonas flava]
MKPLLICDCDEVLMTFAGPFAEHLDEMHGLELKLESFALAGNIRRKSDGEPVPQSALRGLLGDFFSRGMHRQVPAPGAPEALASLKADFDIVILTNIEDEYRDGRREQLRRHGMTYEVFCNSGPKGPALSRLLADHGRPPAVFVDDLPPHHQSVSEVEPQVHRIHMVADPTLRSLIPAAKAAHARIDDWPSASTYLSRLVAEKTLADGGAVRR